MPKQKRNPIEALFNHQKKITTYPDEVKPVPKMLSGTAFFPGGAGLWLGYSGSWYTPSDRPDMPKGKVMILGHNFDSEEGYKETRCLEGQHELYSPTWCNLLDLLRRVGIQQKDCFFTNAYMGLMKGKKNTGEFPKNPQFVECCESFFLEKQIVVQKPRLILALGKHSIKFIAGLSLDLAEWKKCKTFPALDDSDLGPVVTKVRFNDSKPLTVVALVHPAGRNLGNTLKNRRYCGKEGEAAELKMVKKALKKSGLR